MKDIKKICILHSISYLQFYSSTELTEDPPELVRAIGAIGVVTNRGHRGTKLNRTPRNCSSQIGLWLDCFTGWQTGQSFWVHDFQWQFFCLHKAQWGTGHDFSDFEMGYDSLFFFLVVKEQMLSKSTGHSYEFINGLDFVLFQRLANWAVNSSAVLPVTNYLPRWGAMRHWTWFSRLTWRHMSEHIFHCTTMGQRALRKKKRGKKLHFCCAFFFNNRQFITHDDENSAILFPPKYQFAILFCGVCNYFLRPPKNVFSICSSHKMKYKCL